MSEKTVNRKLLEETVRARLKAALETVLLTWREEEGTMKDRAFSVRANMILLILTMDV